jgi:hypothetical protein
MINSVRNTVLSVLNKNNYGYLSPSDFNLFAKQAQLDLFEDYFFRYNRAINAENARRGGTEYAGIAARLQGVIDTFLVPGVLAQVAVDTNSYYLPSVDTTGNDYYLINRVMFGTREVEKVSDHRIQMLINSHLTTPTLLYPSYSSVGNQLTVYPDTITAVGALSCTYIRYPVPPNWTFVELLTGEPVFNQSVADFQNFELPDDDEVSLVTKILQYAGMSIREGEVYQFGKVEEQNEEQSDQ